MTSTENAEHKKGVGLFVHLKISPLLESKQLFSHISVSDVQIIRLKHILKEITLTVIYNIVVIKEL